MKNTNNASNNISRNNTNFGKSSEIKPEYQKILILIMLPANHNCYLQTITVTFKPYHQYQTPITNKSD